MRKEFSKLHEVKAKIEKDSEKTLYLTEGVLTHKAEDFNIHHPLIYKEVGMELIGNIDEPEILIIKSDNESSIYMTVLRSLKVNGTRLNRLKEQFRTLDLDPDNDKIDLFLKELVHTLWDKGKFSEKEVLYLRKPYRLFTVKAIIRKKRESF